MPKDKEKERARKRAYYQQKRQDPEWAAKRAERSLAYHHSKKKDPEYQAKVRAKNRAYGAANREELAAAAREYYAAHREERIAYARAYKEAHGAVMADRRRQRAYDLTPAEYTRLLEQQSGVCAICKRPERAARKGKLRALCVDHCHDSGRVRGLLCSDCNGGLGLFGEDAARLIDASRYVEAHMT